MIDKWRRYSYIAQKERRHRILKILAWVFSVYLAYLFVSTLFVSTVSVENSTMKPGLAPGDRLVVSSVSYGAYLPLFASRLPGPQAPKRGDLVLIDLRNDPESHWAAFGDSLLRFFTAQRYEPNQQFGTKRFVKRIVGVPGDEVSMNDYVMRVRPAGESYGLTEFELTPRPYDLHAPTPPDGWSASVPFSGSFEPVKLADGQYFVVSDDREVSSDSRSWGPIDYKLISGKVVFRYWPLGRFGRP